MIDISKGRYWDEGVTLISSCTPCSPGCDNCWALAMERRFKPEFKNQVTVHPDRLKRFNTKKSKVFAIWNDLFHEDVPDSFIEEVFRCFNVKVLNPEPINTYLILTKRPKRMVEFLGKYTGLGIAPWQHVYFGLTVCNQQEADEKIPIFLQVPGKKFLSIEPSLEEISFLSFDVKMVQCFDVVIMGCETGVNARLMDIEWARTIRSECDMVGVPFFLKQLDKKHNRVLDDRTYDALPWVKNG